MSDRVLFPLMGVAALSMIALALVWPQGVGARSPGVFGHPPPRPPAAAKTKASGQPTMLSLAPPTSSAQAASSGPAQ